MSKREQLEAVKLFVAQVCDQRTALLAAKRPANTWQIIFDQLTQLEQETLYEEHICEPSETA